MGKKSMRAKVQPQGPNTSKPLTSKPQQVQLKVDELPTVNDPSLKLLWVDRVTIAVRSDVPVSTIRCYSVLGRELHEACQFQTSVPHLTQIADLLCRILDYYPVKADPAAK
jgi:hypothetical protein